MIFSNVALGSLGVEDEKAIHVPGFRENIRGVAQLRHLTREFIECQIDGRPRDCSA